MISSDKDISLDQKVFFRYTKKILCVQLKYRGNHVLPSKNIFDPRLLKIILLFYPVTSRLSEIKTGNIKRNI